MKVEKLNLFILDLYIAKQMLELQRIVVKSFDVSYLQLLAESHTQACVTECSIK